MNVVLSVSNLSVSEGLDGRSRCVSEEWLGEIGRGGEG